MRAAPRTEAGERTVLEAVGRAKLGDREAHRLLYEAYSDDVRRFVTTIVRDRSDAEDVTHNVFLKLLTTIGRYEPRDTPFAAWLIRVARNAALDFLRARSSLPLDEAQVSSPDDFEGDLQRAACIRSAFDGLPELQRQVVALRHLAGLSPGEIAQRLDRTEASIHGLHHRGRSALQSALRDLDVAPMARCGPVRSDVRRSAAA